ncbi:MAG TPA: hypothetical protein VNX65_02685 [Patescibacteria group bacterium]|jgi:hypothetical protein|nr:hypothetical protein [Patescibacteria group bacterium]
MDEQPQPPAPVPNLQPDSQKQLDVMEPISWSAAEYTHNTKSVGWYLGFGVAMLVIIIVSIRVGSPTFILLAVVMAVALAVVSNRKPQILNYVLNASKLQIDQKSYAISEFKSFGVTSEGTSYSIALIPVKRFMPAIHIYFTEENGEKIVDILSSHLTMQQTEPDFVEKFFSKIHF